MSKKATLGVDTIHAAAVADEQHSFADEATQSVFGNLSESTIGYRAREKWEESVRKIEDEYMEKVHSATAGAMTKGSGKPGSPKYVAPRWKYRTHLPIAWSSSKSVCGQALELGIKLDKDSKKTATENEIKQVKEDNVTEKTPEQKLDIVMDTAKKVLAQFDDTGRAKAVVKFGLTGSYFNV